jgi:hypothetical protein
MVRMGLQEPKELFVIEGLTHADLYDHVDVAGPKLVKFFGKALAQVQEGDKGR